ncbi:hypothetical protein RSOLAG1IB_10844 [Rhizoctonia solani AG-1 IB]|uniref:RNase H type-1 domain-containing protein n=2 Tax=Thanatephorus cucumeris (strain AG1-IB / isolate 7/3/14) TaxID=1108050 RepID=A0A0B7G4W9_THACB|nr:hypothetical protein RSOLAG1IB_10844 [Rhizoctonia solani AG-1 IB]
MHLLMNKVCQRAAIRLAATPVSHPLHKAVLKCSKGGEKHQPPLQQILQFVNVKPTDFKRWLFNRRSLLCLPPELFQDRHIATAEAWADKLHLLIFADAMASKTGVATAAVLWSNGNKDLQAGIRLGERDSILILDTEVAAIMLATHLALVFQEDTVVDNVAIYSNSQAAIVCINNHSEGASNQLLRAMCKVIRAAKKGSGGTAIDLKWCPGHSGVPGNKEADTEASQDAAGLCYPPQLVPHYLANFRPATNPASRKQAIKTKNRVAAETYWAQSKAGTKFASMYPGISPSLSCAYTKPY